MCGLTYRNILWESQRTSIIQSGQMLLLKMARCSLCTKPSNKLSHWNGLTAETVKSSTRSGQPSKIDKCPLKLMLVVPFSHWRGQPKLRNTHRHASCRRGNQLEVCIHMHWINHGLLSTMQCQFVSKLSKERTIPYHKNVARAQAHDDSSNLGGGLCQAPLN